MLLLIVGLTTVVMGQATLNDDAQTINTPKDGDSNFGTNPNLTVGSINNVYVKFKLSPALPPSTVATDLAKATLKLYVSNVSSLPERSMFMRLPAIGMRRASLQMQHRPSAFW
jgi:hypothetical protein